MAAGIIIGAAFGAVIKSLVTNIITPPIGLLLGNVDFSNLFITLKADKVAGPYASLVAAQTAGAVTLNLGMFINTIISFVIMAFAVFFLIRAINRLQREPSAPPAVPTKECPHCASEIPLKAPRCPHCTTELGAAPA